MKANGWTRDKAFRIGFSWGAVNGLQSPSDADRVLRERNLPTDDEHVTLFCNGAEDGVRGDNFRLTSATPVSR